MNTLYYSMLYGANSSEVVVAADVAPPSVSVMDAALETAADLSLYGLGSLRVRTLLLEGDVTTDQWATIQAAIEEAWSEANRMYIQLFSNNDNTVV